MNPSVKRIKFNYLGTFIHTWVTKITNTDNATDPSQGSYLWEHL